jgi:dUTP pyrophosphatase
MEVKIKLLDGQMPAYSRDGDACLDCYAAEEVTISSGETKKIRLGFVLELPKGYEAQIRPRSGLSLKGVQVQLGTIDSKYRGEVNAIVHYADSMGYFEVHKGTRIAQMKIEKVEPVTFVEVAELSETNRGGNGFGSSGM